MKRKLGKKLSGGILLVILTSFFLTALAAPAAAGRRVRRYHRVSYRHCTVPVRTTHVVYTTPTTIHRYHPRYGVSYRYTPGYYYGPYYRPYRGPVSCGVRVIF